MKRLIVLLVLVAAVAYFVTRRKEVPVNEAERISNFTQSMSGVTLVGHSARPSGQVSTSEERYRIEKVTHVSGSTFLFQTRLMFEDHDIPVPIPLSVLWAGDTPVITMTDLAIPGLSSYTARVVLYGDQYAGTWSGKHGGGQVFGKIVRDTKP